MKHWRRFQILGGRFRMLLLLTCPLLASPVQVQIRGEGSDAWRVCAGHSGWQ